jgi:hypothetical protein
VTTTTVLLRLHNLTVASPRTWVRSDLIDAVWDAGERRGNRIAQAPGMNLLMGEAAEPLAAMATAIANLQAIALAVGDAVRDGTEATLDVALYLTEGNPMLSARFCQDDLRLLADLGIALIVTAYQASG